MVVVAFTMVTVIFSVYNLQVRSAQNSSPENKNFLIYHNQTCIDLYSIFKCTSLNNLFFNILVSIYPSQSYFWIYYYLLFSLTNIITYYFILIASRNTFYEFCDQEFVHRIDLLAYNVTWYILAVDDKFYPNELSILTTVEGMINMGEWWKSREGVEAV